MRKAMKALTADVTDFRKRRRTPARTRIRIMRSKLRFGACAAVAAGACVLLFAAPTPANAAVIYTPVGKIVSVEGHHVPNCRQVQFKENASGTTHTVRIPDNPSSTETGLMAAALSALLADRDVVIGYDPAVTTGCGPQPKLLVVSVR